MERFTIEIDLRGKVNVLGVRVSGEVDEETAPELRRILGGTTQGDGIVTVIIDLSGVTVMAPAGVEALVAAHQQIRGAGAALRIVNAAPVAVTALRTAGEADLLTVTQAAR